MPTPLEALTALLHSPYIRPWEKRAGLTRATERPSQLAALTTRAQSLITQRSNDPNSLENWAAGQRLARAESTTESDYVNTPSRFAGRHGIPLATTR